MKERAHKFIDKVRREYPDKKILAFSHGFFCRIGDVDALKNINLTINDGEIYGIIGMSGAGKSTLVRCINMLERPTGGQVIIDGKNMELLSDKELREARRDITMIFQSFNLLMQRNCLKNVCFPMELAGVKKAEAEKRAMELLELVGLPDKAKAYPAQLSGGQQQRVAIARALATNPKVLLCDEATSALDPNTTHSILSLIRDINKKLGITVVI
ncbi:MAG: ATP-binding cassette domain-containing protein, partial [Bacteroidaceae bacterium]|nr:ATP-binding cassette domain-containing protein [Bacteroidaceae bacterium]